MLTLAYNLSGNIEKSLKGIELSKQSILLSPIRPRDELQLKWEAMNERIHWSMLFAGISLNKKTITNLLTTVSKKKLTSEEQAVINYRKAFTYIIQDWTLSPEPVTPATIATLHHIILTGNSDRAQTRMSQDDQKSIKYMLDYLQTGSENPIIQAGIVEVQLVDIAPFNDGNGRTARLTAYLILYKHGYNIRDLLIMEEYWQNDLIDFRHAARSASENNNLTLWLEYFVNSIAAQMKRAAKRATNQLFTTDIPSSFWEINDRQKQILSLLDEPISKITNMNVQDTFKVSQITASRDLAKLANLGLLFAHGKGRSVYYTKV